MNNQSLTTNQRLRVVQRFATALALILMIAGAIQASPLLAAEKVKNDTKTIDTALQAPIPISKVDIHATDLSTQPNMHSTGVMVDAEGRIHVMCVDPLIPDLASRLQTLMQATDQTISDR